MKKYKVLYNYINALGNVTRTKQIGIVTIDNDLVVDVTGEIEPEVKLGTPESDFFSMYLRSSLISIEPI